MPRKFHWDLIRIMVVIGGILGVVFSILRFLGVYSPITGFFAPDLLSFILEVATCGLMAVGWGILGLDVWENSYPFLVFIGVGLALIFLFGNIAGVLFVVVAIPIPFGS